MIHVWYIIILLIIIIIFILIKKTRKGIEGFENVDINIGNVLSIYYYEYFISLKGIYVRGKEFGLL